MSVPAKRRRWWIWGVLFAGALLIAAPAAWRYRPLNRTERQLIGTWSVVTQDWPDYDTMTFTSDRRFVRQHHVRFLNTPPPTDGRWDASRPILTIVDTSDDRPFAAYNAPPVWRGLLARVQAFLSGNGADDQNRVTMSLEIESIDAFRTTSSEGLLQTWRRLPPDQGE